MGDPKRQLFVPGPTKFTKRISFPSAFRVTRFRLPVSRPLRKASRNGAIGGWGEESRGPCRHNLYVNTLCDRYVYIRCVKNKSEFCRGPCRRPGDRGRRGRERRHASGRLGQGAAARLYAAVVSFKVIQV